MLWNKLSSPLQVALNHNRKKDYPCKMENTHCRKLNRCKSLMSPKTNCVRHKVGLIHVFEVKLLYHNGLRLKDNVSSG